VKSLVGAVLDATRPRAATNTPVPLARDGAHTGNLFGISNRDRDSQMRTIESNGTLWSIVNRTSTAVANLDWHLYEKTPQRSIANDRIEIGEHAVLDLLDTPNGHMSGSDLLEIGQQHVDMTGEAYWIISRAGRQGIPIEIWPVPPNRMEPVPSAKRFLAGWIYTAPSGEQIPLTNDEVIQTKMPHPRDPYRGLGPVQAMLTELDAYRYSVEWNRNFFINSARPGGIIKLLKTMGDNEFNQFVARWNEQHRGVQRANRVAVLEEAEWVETQMTLRDMEFTELHNQSRDDLFVAFGISGAVMGVTDDINRSNAEAGQAMFAELLTKPRGGRWRGRMNSALLLMYGRDTQRTRELDFDDPTPKNVELENETFTAKSDAAATMVGAGFDSKGTLEWLEMPPIPWTAPPTPVLAPPGPGQDEDPDGPDALPPAAARLALPPARNTAPQAPDLSEVDEQWQYALLTLTAHYQSTITPGQRAQVLAAIAAHVDAGEIAALGALSIGSDTGAGLLLAAMMAYADIAAQQAAAEIMRQGGSTQPATPAQSDLAALAVVIAALLAAELAVSAGREALRVLAAGMRGQEVADLVGQYLRTLSDAGARQHLGAGLSAAQNKARLLTFLAGPDAALYSTEVNDTNTCPPCRQINGTYFGLSSDPSVVAKIEQSYPAGGYIDCEGRDRCRGTVIAVVLNPHEGV
jgi:HK97 family phage portal protein